MTINLPPDSSESSDLLVIDDHLSIPMRELQFRFSRSGGPGGQHVNRTETRVELLFDVAHAPSLSDAQRARLLERLQGRLDGEGVLHLVSAATRSQLENRGQAVARLRAILQGALRPVKKRLATRPTAAGRERRLTGKRARAQIKSGRRYDPFEDES